MRKSRSKSKSGSRKRGKVSRERVLSTSNASNAGRLISSASTSDKRSVKQSNISSMHIQSYQLDKITEKPVKNSYSKKIPQSKTGNSKSTNSTAVKPNKNKGLKSERIKNTKDRKGSLSNTIMTIKNESSEKEKEKSMELKRFGSVFTESDK